MMKKSIISRKEKNGFWTDYSNAKKKKQLITNTNHCIIETVHPSPLSAYNGFFGSRPFSKANKFLMNKEIEPVDWSVLK